MSSSIREITGDILVAEVETGDISPFFKTPIEGHYWKTSDDSYWTEQLWKKGGNSRPETLEEYVDRVLKAYDDFRLHGKAEDFNAVILGNHSYYEFFRYYTGANLGYAVDLSREAVATRAREYYAEELVEYEKRPRSGI